MYVKIHTYAACFLGEKTQVVAPFAGEVTKEDGNTIKLVVQEGSLKGTIIYITNIEAKSTIEEEESRSVRMKNIYKFVMLARCVDNLLGFNNLYNLDFHNTQMQVAYCGFSF